MARFTPSATLLVDGYNIIGASPALSTVRDRDGLDTARRDLIEALANYTTVNTFQTEIVFDAQFTRTARSKELIMQHLWVCYTDYNQTADTYIEKVCASFHGSRLRLGHRLIVATSDRAHQLTVVGYGAEWMSAHQLLADVEVARNHVRDKLRSLPKARRRLLSNSIDPTAMQKLSQMRFGHRPKER